MRTIRSIKAMQNAVRQRVARGQTVGLVPTMGFLHAGHISLIERAAKETDCVIVTIFVNPTQFAPTEDLTKYPRDEKGDLKKARDAGAELVFMPSRDDMYPDDFQTWVEVAKLTQSLEGASRPTHFKGVTTIVAKLFNICSPDVVIFGMKDYQQAMVLKQMAHDLNYPVKFIIAPTVRESDGLAMSSRNKYFTPTQRDEAVCLYKGLEKAKTMVKDGTTDVKKVEKAMRKEIESVCPSVEIVYIAFTDLLTLEPVTEVGKDTVCSLAAHVHGVRLIDNMKLA